MGISFDKALGIHDDAMLLRARRAEVLANNIANGDTPGFHARDLDFRAILSEHIEPQGEMRATDDRHFHSGKPLELNPGALMYRVPHQANADSSSIDMALEKAEFARNALQHQASFTFLNGRFKGLTSALRGE